MSRCGGKTLGLWVWLLASMSLTLAVQTTFHVIAPKIVAQSITADTTSTGKNLKLITGDDAKGDSNSNLPLVTVLVNGQTVPMTAANPSLPHFTASADLPDGAKYKYSVDGVEESFDRAMPQGKSGETFNDFFNRSSTVQILPPFPWPLQDEGGGQWQRASSPYPLFDDSYIPTLFFSNPQGSPWDAIAAKQATTVTLYIVLKDQILEFNNTYWSFYKADSWKSGTTFNITQDQAAPIGGRTDFKLRTGEYDPTQLREKTYTDLMHSLGVPAAQEIHIRAYVNNEPIGLFVLTDLRSAAPSSQVNQGLVNFQKGDPANMDKIGVTLDCGTGATFEYKSDNPSDYNSCSGAQQARSDAQMVVLAKTLSEVNNDTVTQDALDKVLDTELVLRQMVMEYLTLNWDGYWDGSSNFIMYLDDKASNQWTFVDQDFDQTFGAGSDAANDPPKSYKNYPAERSGLPPGGRPLINNLLATTKWRTRFEAILTKVVQHTFNPVAFNRRIDALVDRIRPEVFWDHSFGSDGTKFFAYADFDPALTGAVDSRGKPGQGVPWGLKTFVQARAQGVADEFKFQWDTTPVDPPASPSGASSLPNESSQTQPSPATSDAPTGVSMPIWWPASLLFVLRTLTR